jgi:hypothetical protein
LKIDRLYVGWQDPESREWIPVALLRRFDYGYVLSYTVGVKRTKGFAGLGRMSDFAKAYASATLFPFFSNRVIAKSRPEYSSYMKWLDLESAVGDPMTILALTGGVRTTDSFELITPPLVEADAYVLNFFPRGLRYLGKGAISDLELLERGSQLFIAKDLQNKHDTGALLLRSETPPLFAGYVPRYYCAGINAALDECPSEVIARVKKVNPDAPLTMRYLCRIEVPRALGPKLLPETGDFEILDSNEIADLSREGATQAKRGIEGSINRFRSPS